MLTSDSFLEICQCFGLYNLVSLVSTYDKFYRAEEAFIAANRILATEADQKAAGSKLEIAGLELDQGLYLSVGELRVNVAECRLRDSPRLSEVPNSVCESETTDHQENATASPGISFESPMASPRTSVDAEAGLEGADASQNGSTDLVLYDPAGQGTVCMRETNDINTNEGSLFLPSQPSIDSGYASIVGSQQVYGTTSMTSSSGTVLSNAEGGREAALFGNATWEPAAGSEGSTEPTPAIEEASSLDILATAAMGNGGTVAGGLAAPQSWNFDLSNDTNEDLQSWNFDPSNEIIEDLQSWNFDPSNDTNEDLQSWNFDLHHFLNSDPPPSDDSSLPACL